MEGTALFLGKLEEMIYIIRSKSVSAKRSRVRSFGHTMERLHLVCFLLSLLFPTLLLTIQKFFLFCKRTRKPFVFIESEKEILASFFPISFLPWLKQVLLIKRASSYRITGRDNFSRAGNPKERGIGNRLQKNGKYFLSTQIWMNTSLSDLPATYDYVLELPRCTEWMCETTAACSGGVLL